MSKYKKNNNELNIHKRKIQQTLTKDIKQKKYPFWFNLVLIIIPIVFFILLEVILRVSNYNKDTTLWIEIAPGYTALNPDVGYRYFHSTNSIPYSNRNCFKSIKGENSFRVFIMGGSSAAGYPYTPNGDFGLYIKKKLEILYPENEIEVINISLTATNSYTIRDILPGVIKQKPDLILLYAGHNEYYGALGVGSMESIGQSRSVINFMISLEKYKSFVLLRNLVQWVQSLFSGDGSNAIAKETGTLMSRMAKDQTIPFNSEVFNLGVKQFEGNLNDILEMCQQSKVPVILGTLTCNLKDLKPFSSIEDSTLPKAEDIFELAQSKLDNTIEALKLFKYAKDLDGLRFRAPEKINEVINTSAIKYGYPVVNIDSIFNSESTFGITGDNLMTDHLHPTFNGYQIIGKSYFDEMVRNKFLPLTGKTNISEAVADSLADSNTFISKLDSVIAEYRILVLKNDWPYSAPKSVEYMLKLFNQQTLVDTLAVKVLDNRYSWERAHREAAQYYINNGDLKEFIREMKILINQYPFVKEYYTFAIENLLEVKLFTDAYYFLEKGNKVNESAFFLKWLGIIDLSENKIQSAIDYLKRSSILNGNDPQVFFNLAGAYSMLKMYREALVEVEKCLRLNNNYPGAQKLKIQLDSAIRNS